MNSIARIFKIHKRKVVTACVIIFVISMPLYYFYPIKLSERINLQDNSIKMIEIHYNEYINGKIEWYKYTINDPNTINEIRSILANVQTIKFFIQEPERLINYSFYIVYNDEKIKPLALTMTEGHVSIHGFANNHKNYVIPAAAKKSREAIKNILDVLSTQSP